jgi:hypothetical protein
MESLESRIARLAPEQQREVEDFVDFLLLKNNIRQTPVNAPPVMLNTPPVMVPDPASAHPFTAVPGPEPANPDESFSPVVNADPPPSPIHEITVGDDDRISRDYMDYGKFEEPQSPAADAVRKARQKIIVREEQDKSRHLLDWVD